MKVIGPQSVIGRSIAVYSGEEDLRKAGHENLLTNGNAGKIVGAVYSIRPVLILLILIG